MPQTKMKTHKGILKRCKVSARGKVVHKRAGGNHLMSWKSGKRCRRIRRKAVLSKELRRRIQLAVGRGRDYRPESNACHCGECGSDSKTPR